MIRVASGEKDEDKTFSKAMSVFAGFGLFRQWHCYPS
jgi:hypothetical protein